MGNISIHCTDIRMAINVYDLIKLYGYRPISRPVEQTCSDVIKMYSKDYIDMVNNVPFMAMVMDDPLTVTKIIEES